MNRHVLEISTYVFSPHRVSVRVSAGWGGWGRVSGGTGGGLWRREHGKLPATHEGMAGNSSPQHTCILAIDDDPSFLGFLKEVLERHGHRVHAVSSPKEAIKLYDELWREIGMVLLDFNMPGMSGDMVFEELQRLNPDVRAVLLTSCQGSVADALFKKGLRGYLPKPFGLAELADTVRQVISDPARSLGSPVPA